MTTNNELTPDKLLKKLALPTPQGGGVAEDEYADFHRKRGVKLKKKYTAKKG